MSNSMELFTTTSTPPQQRSPSPPKRAEKDEYENDDETPRASDSLGLSKLLEGVARDATATASSASEGRPGLIVAEYTENSGAPRKRSSIRWKGQDNAAGEGAAERKLVNQAASGEGHDAPLTAISTKKVSAPAPSSSDEPQVITAAPLDSAQLEANAEVAPVPVPELAAIEEKRTEELPAEPEPHHVPIPSPIGNETYLDTLKDGVPLFLSLKARTQLGLPEDWSQIQVGDDRFNALQLLERRIGEEVPKAIVNRDEELHGQKVVRVVDETNFRKTPFRFHGAYARVGLFGKNNDRLSDVFVAEDESRQDGVEDGYAPKLMRWIDETLNR